MKKRKIGKKKIIVFAICVCAVLCGTTAYALVQSNEKIMGGKLAQIDRYEQQAEELMEADSYNYKGELEISINSVLTAVEDSERFLKENPEKSSKKEEKRLSSLRTLCERYEKELENNGNHKKLLEDYRRELDEINSRYR